MKIKIDAKELIKEQKKIQKRCVELIGRGKFSVANLEKIVEELKRFNESLTQNCLSTTLVQTKTCGGSAANLELPTTTQGKLYQDNQYLILALTQQIDIAKANNLEFVTDFSFTTEQILNYGQQKNIIR